MTITQWLLFFGIVQVIHFLGTWKLYVRAGRKAWEAAVPVYNAVILMKIINRPWWWVFLLFIPIVNLLMFPVVWTETARSYGFNTYKDTALVVLTCGLYLFYINYATDAPYIESRSLQPKSSNGEWVSSIIFAVVAATIVHTYFMQPFVIPSSSLEKTLLVGDYLLVSKFHYGARTPITTVSTPMLHDSLPKLHTKSYLSKPQLPYFRLPGFQKIKRNDIVVFSWPVDTLIDIRPGHMYGSVRKPVDKKSNYVKRCVGMPGDSLEVRDGYVYINGVQNDLPDRAKIQFSYWIKWKDNKQALSDEMLYKRYGITDGYALFDDTTGEFMISAVTEEAMNRLKNHPNTESIRRDIAGRNIPYMARYNESKTRRLVKYADPTNIFPNQKTSNWNNSNFGGIYIPEKGKTVAITPESIHFYKRIIEVYEGYEMGIERSIEISGTQVFLNGTPLTEYTFQQDYYWLMGDNRGNSQDARSWGYVPYNHVVGKPVFVWFSLDKNKTGFFNSIRWDRVFTTVSGSGKATSFKWVLFVLIGLFVASFFKKKKPASK